ncbi:efflux RND transporter periplasmic adaptor subunit [Mesorhizobium xinjiangense]|uniref:efflux RND transporter periplasmic adaptor subunit n=1 Tax=Mesorhizobium xinjiangense TaxID=2678685 RepID=UPI0012ED8588|nr:efflux RND transporter periplasmic adaptor subunit [Mesorhizobium xinjiangense]
MPKIPFHRLAAFVVLAVAAAWVVTGQFSSVGSAVAVGEEDPAASTSEPPATPLRTVAVVAPQHIDHARTIRISGVTEANKRSSLAARSGGIIDTIPVSEGSLVKKGDLILALDAEERPAAVAMAEALVAQRESEYDAAQKLLKSGNMAKLQGESARAALTAARSQLETAKAELARSEIRAPFDGIVDQVDVEEGSAIQQGAEVATILSLDPVLAVGEVSEQDLSQLEPGASAEVRLVNGQRVSGALRYLSRDASPQTRTFRIEVAVPNPDRAIPAGMTAEIVLQAEKVRAVKLPRSVVTLSERGELGIRIATPDDTVNFIPIDIVEDTPEALVLAGIPEDARIIVSGQELVSEGDKVATVEANESVIRRLVGDVAAR